MRTRLFTLGLVALTVLFVLVCLVAPVTARAQAGAYVAPANNGAPITTVAGLAGYKTKGQIAAVTDGTTATDCTAGGGSTTVLCQYSGASWASSGGGGSQVYPGAGVPNSSGSSWNASYPVTGGGTNAVICTPSSPLAGDLWAFNNSGVCVNKTPGVAGRSVSIATDTISCASGTGDRGGLITYTNAGLVTITIPQAGTGACVSNFYFRVNCIGAGGCKLVSTTSAINTIAGATGVTWPGNTSGDCISPDNANWTCTGFRVVKAGTNVTETLNNDQSVSLNASAGGSATEIVTQVLGTGNISGTSDIMFMGVGAGTSVGSGSNAYSVMAGAGTVSALYVKFQANLAATDSFAITVYHNGVASAMTCTVAASTATCNTTANSFTFVAGDTLGYHSVCTGAGNCNTSPAFVSLSSKLTGVS